MLGAVLEDADQPPGQPRKQLGAIERIGDRRRVGIEEHDQVDVGGEIQLMRAELAHAEHDPARAAGRDRPDRAVPACRAACAVAQQEIDCRADARHRRGRSAAAPSSRSGLAAEIGQRDQEMRLRLQRAQRRHQRGFRHLRSAASRAIAALIAASRLAVVCRTARRALAGRRRAASRRNGERSKTAREEIAPRRRLRRAARQAAASSASAAAAARSGERRARPRCGRAASSAAASTDRLRAVGVAGCRGLLGHRWLALRRETSSSPSGRDRRPASSRRPPWNFMTALARLSPRPEPGCERLFSSRTKRSVARCAVGRVGNARAVVGNRQADLAAARLERHRRHRRLARRNPAEYLMALSTMLDSAWPISSRLPLTGEGSLRRRPRAPRPTSSAAGS